MCTSKLDQKSDGGEGVSCGDTQGKQWSRQRSCQCKGPEIGPCLASLKDSRKDSVAIKKYNILGLDFPRGPMVKTLCLHCRGCRFDPWLGKLRSHMWCGAKEINTLVYI